MKEENRKYFVFNPWDQRRYENIYNEEFRSFLCCILWDNLAYWQTAKIQERERQRIIEIFCDEIMQLSYNA